MDNAKFIKIYNESRNGANGMLFNPLYPKLNYSDGVRDCAETGCYWLLDIIGTECLVPLRKQNVRMGVITVKVANEKAVMTLITNDDMPPAWSREMDYTDMPEGEWLFYLSDEGERFVLILPSEY